MIKPRILYNEYHPEHEEKPVAEPTTKTSEDYHGGDEITQSMKDQRFAQQQNNDNQPNNDNAQPEQQQNGNAQSQINGNQQATEQQNNDIQQTNENQQNELQSDNETNQQNNDNAQTGEHTNENTQSQSNNDQQNNDNNAQTEQQNETETNQQQNNESEEQTLDDSVSDDYQEQEVEDEEEEDDYYEDEEEQEYTIQYNTQQAFKINEEHNTEKQLYLTFYRLVEYLSDEEKQPTLLPGQTLVLNVKKLMMRQYERKPLNAYYYYRTRSQVVLILDNSGSMAWLMDELSTFFKAAVKRKDVIIYVAPNGHIEEYYNDKTKLSEIIEHEDAIQQIIRSGLPVIYVGDFDGANTPIELSWTNRVYWICTETRYKYFSHHDWVGRCIKGDIYTGCEEFKPYHEDDFKGFFGRAFNDKEIITVLKEFAKNIYKQRFWYDKHDIEDFSNEVRA